MKGVLERVFRLKENHTSIKTEIIAGLTTFMTMAYIIFVNPSLLSDAGMSWNAVFTATIAASILGTVMMAFLTNYPFVQAPGMGMNAFFVYSVCIGMGISWQVALGIIFLEGILFIILSITPVRETIINCIPMGLKASIGAGIGLFIAFIGLQNGGIVVPDENTILTIGHLFAPGTIVALFGLLLTGILCGLKVRGAMLWGILGATAFGTLPWLGVTPPYAGFIEMPKLLDWGEVLLALNIREALNLSMLGILLTFLVMDLFNTAGTLIGVSTQAGYLDEEGNLPKASKALLADAIATTGGALFGTSTVTTYVESASGVLEGGRTGLTGLVVSLLFLLSLFFRPLVGMVPAEATAPALVVVGTLMLNNILKIDWEDYTEVFPAFICMVSMPLTSSVSHGIALGFIFYPLLKLFTGRGREVHWVVYTLGCVFFLYYLFLS